MGAYTLEEIVPRLYVARTNDQHLHEGSTCSHHWTIQGAVRSSGDPFVTLVAIMIWHCPTASKWFLTSQVHTPGATFALICVADALHFCSYNASTLVCVYSIWLSRTWSAVVGMLIGLPLSMSKLHRCARSNAHCTSPEWPFSLWWTKKKKKKKTTWLDSWLNRTLITLDFIPAYVTI